MCSDAHAFVITLVVGSLVAVTAWKKLLSAMAKEALQPTVQ